MARPADLTPPMSVGNDDSSPFPLLSESRMETKRPPLRRTKRCQLPPDFFSSSCSEESDDDDDEVFCSRFVMPNHHVKVITGSDSDSESDSEDDELAKIIRLTPVSVESLKTAKASHVPAPATPPPPPAVNPVPSAHDDFDFSAPPVYHGFSYAAFGLVKRVWDIRRDAWNNQPAAAVAAAAYGGIALSPEPQPQDRPPLVPQRVASSDPSAPIYPRIGSLAGLHDPQSAAMDRAFCRFPMYTMRKILFLHEMLRSSSRLPPPTTPTAPQPRSPTDSDEEDTLVGDEHADEDLAKGKKRAPLSSPILTATEWQRTWLERWQFLVDVSTTDPLTVSPRLTSPEDTALRVEVLEHTTRQWACADVDIHAYSVDAYADTSAYVEETSICTDESEDEDAVRSRLMEEAFRPQSPKFFFAGSDDDDDDDDWDALEEDFRGLASCSAAAQFLSRRDMNHPNMMAMA